MERKKVTPHKLTPEIYRALEDIVGKEWISQDRAIVETYSKLSGDIDTFLRNDLSETSRIPPSSRYHSGKQLFRHYRRYYTIHNINVCRLFSPVFLSHSCV